MIWVWRASRARLAGGRLYCYYIKADEDHLRSSQAGGDPAHRSLDFADASLVFAGPVLEIADNRQDYGEVRIQTIGTLAGRLVMVVWTPRGKARRIVSMRYCNDRERKIYGPRIP